MLYRALSVLGKLLAISRHYPPFYYTETMIQTLKRMLLLEKNLLCSPIAID